jgi:hypothetical protein
MCTWQQDPFFLYPQARHSTSAGDVALPIFYYNNSNLILLYEVDHERAAALIDGEQLEVVTVSRNKALVAVACYEYRDTSIGSYNEVGVAIATVPCHTKAPPFPWLALYQPVDYRHLGFTVIDLPVTTDIACAGGRELWGFPKFVTDIGFSLTQSGFRCTVKDPDTDTQIVDIHGKPGMGIPAPQLDLVLYSIKESDMLRSLAITRGGGRLSLPGSLRLHLGKSEHPMAQRLKALGLDALKPMLVFHSQSLQLRLNAGVTTAQKKAP